MLFVLCHLGEVKPQEGGSRARSRLETGYEGPGRMEAQASSEPGEAHRGRHPPVGRRHVPHLQGEGERGG